MEYDLKRNKERLGNNAQGEIKDNVETDAASADARETSIRKNVLNIESQREREGDIVLKIRTKWPPRMQKNLSKEQVRSFRGGGGDRPPFCCSKNLVKIYIIKVNYYGVASPNHFFATI